MSKPIAVPLSPEVAPTVGLYSHAYAAPAGMQLVAVAGQLAVDHQGESLVGSFEEQMRAVVHSLDCVLSPFGGLSAVVKFTTYLTNPDNIARFYAEREQLWPAYLGSAPYPPNTLLVVQRLVRPEFLIEIEALAVADPASLTTPVR
jgi:enamine deaminase RidA (YjgF/YER057c/UK114 family)